MKAVYSDRENEIGLLVARVIEELYNEGFGGAVKACLALRELKVDRSEVIQARDRVLKAPYFSSRHSAIRNRYNCEAVPVL